MDRRFKPVFLKRKSDGENKVRKEVDDLHRLQKARLNMTLF